MILAFKLDKAYFPSWARWVAQDQNGVWWAYEVEPLQFHKGWYENEVGRNFRLANDFKPVVSQGDWKNSLIRVNQ